MPGTFAYIGRVLRSLGRDAECGECSGIPRCCILYYLLVWQWLYARRDLKGRRGEPRFMGYYWRLIAARERTAPLRRRPVPGLSRARLLYRPKISYIPCPFCVLRGSFVEVRDCPEEGCPLKGDRADAWIGRPRWDVPVEVEVE